MTLDRVTQTLYTGSYDGVVCGRDLSGNNDASRLTVGGKAQLNGAVHNGQVAALAVVHGGLVSVGWDDKMRFASIESGVGAYHTEVALDGQPRGIATCLASTDLVVVVTMAGVALYRGAQKVGEMTKAELGFEPTCAALYNEEEVVIGGADFKTHIYALSNLVFSPVKVIETRSAVTALAYHPTGECLAIGDAGRQIELHHRGTWEVRSKGKWVHHTSRISCLAWSPEGKYLASGSVDESIYIWNATNENARKQIALAHSGGVSGLDWLAEGKLVSTGSDCAVVTWNIPAFE
jgi:WD40 repeat protein